MPRVIRLRPKVFMSVPEVAIVISVSKTTIYRSVNRGDFPIPHFRINGVVKFLRKDVEALLRGENSENTLNQ